MFNQPNGQTFLEKKVAETIVFSAFQLPLGSGLMNINF